MISGYMKKSSEGLLVFILALIFWPANAEMQAAGMIVGDPANAGKAVINGYVRDKSTGETLIGATVQLKESGIGAVTNKAGYYSIANIIPGKYTVVFSFLGYRRMEMEVSLKADESRRIDIELVSEYVELDEVVVEGNRADDSRQITVSRINIPIKQITQLRVGGESDVFRSIQYLPGVLASSQISSGLYIRGGSPDQTLVLLDGSTVYNPTHLFGFFSTFNPDAIKDVELIKGGYPAQYGGRMAAVLDLVQRDGNRNDIEGTASVGLISSRLSLQGPLGNGSWFLGGRRTYIDFITGFLESAEDPLPGYYFYDANAKISQDIGTSDKVALSGFLGEDEMDLNNNAGLKATIGISNRAGSGRWTHLFSDNVFSVFNLSYSRYGNNFHTENSGFQTVVENSITDLTLKGNLEWFVSHSLTFKSGLEVNRYELQYLQNFTGNADSAIQEGSTSGGALFIKDNDHVLSGFGQANYQFSNLFSAQAGLRVNYYQMRDIAKLDPRLAMRYQMQPGFAVKAAWGIYHQYFRLATLPDFSFFDTWLPTDSTVNPGRAVHYVLGVETNPMDGYDFNVELYYKALSNVSELRQFATQSRTVKDVFYNGTGDAYGIEFFLQKRVGRLTGWIGYALGYIDSHFAEINDGEDFRPKWDRRHDFKLVGQYKLNERWEFGATFTFQTGQSYTGQTSRFEATLPGDNLGKGITVPAQRYGLRLPPSHQLNLNVNYITTLFGLPTRVLFDIYNVYSRRDIWFRYYDTTKKVTEVTDVRLLPILPSVAIEIKF